MYHMLSCFNLKPGVRVESFRESLEAFFAEMKEHDLVHDIGPLTRRHRHPIMDTDEARGLDYAFLLTFRDRQQCDRAVAHIQPGPEPGNSLHRSMYSMIEDPVFSCWEEI